MSTSIESFISDLERIKAELPKEAERLILGKLKAEIIDLNTGSQLFDLGIDSEGKFLGNYSSFTIFDKKQRGLPFNRITLFNYGDFYRGWDLRIVNNAVQFFSRDSKSSMLQDDYGSSIFGLTTDNAYKLNYELLAPKLDEFIAKNIR